MSFNDRDYTVESLVKQLSLIELHSKDGSAVDAGCACIEGKHLYAVEGLAEEGQGFGLSAKEKQFYGKLADVARKLRKTIEDGSFVFPTNPVGRLYHPSGLSECEKRYPSVQRKLSSCIQRLEKREGAYVSFNPVALCRKSVKCPPS